MKYLIMCEGPNELEVIRILLENDMLLISENELLGLTPYHARQIATAGQVKAELNIYPGEVTVLRIGDTQSEKLRIPQEYRDKIVDVKKYCTKPELEMLLIIAEGLTSEYEKVKSSMKPKTFAKQHIRCGRKKYDNSTAFYRDYFGENPKMLAESIREYRRRNGSHKNDCIRRNQVAAFAAMSGHGAERVAGLK